MATDEGFPDTTDRYRCQGCGAMVKLTDQPTHMDDLHDDRRADPGPLPAPPVDEVNRLRDAMHLTVLEHGLVIDYVTGYDPRCMLAALDNVSRRRAERTAALARAEQRIVPDGFTAGIFGGAHE
jgi:hypothetical protein